MAIALVRNESESPCALSSEGDIWQLSDGRELCSEYVAGRCIITIDDNVPEVLSQEDIEKNSVHNISGVALVSLGIGRLIPNFMADISVVKKCLDIPFVYRAIRKKVCASLYTINIELYEGCEVNCYRSRCFGGPVIVYGRCQTGKTRETCTETCKSIKIYQCPGLFIVRPLKGERSSQTAALSKFARDIDPDIEVVEVNAEDDARVFQDLQQAIRVDNNKKKKTLFILMGNHTTLRRATSHLRENDRLRYIVALDEADIYMKSNAKVDSKTWTRLKPILDGALEQFYITATPLDVIGNIDPSEKPRIVLTKFALTDHVEGEDIYYRSLHSALRRDLPVTTNSCEDAIENGQQILLECFQDRLHEEYYNLDLPMFFVHFHSERVVPNARIAEQISHQLYGRDEIVALTFDNEGGSVGGSKVKVYRKGQVISHEIDDLSVALTWLINIGIKVIYFMGGKTCSRAFRVTDTEFRVYPSVMIYNYNDNCSDGALLDQRMGRMNGLTHTDLRCRQHIYSSEQNLNRSLDVIDACSEIVNGWLGVDGSPFETVSEQVKRPPRYSRKSLSRTRTENKFSIDPSRTSMHSRENRLMERTIGEVTETSETRVRQRGKAALTKRIESILISAGVKQGDKKGYKSWRTENGFSRHERLYHLLDESDPDWESNAKTHYPGGVKNGIRVWMQRFGIIESTK
tara:strand:- start:777 stop:2843 length:2067 start_codon:yes stop_codon:yes gene_type:complete